MGSIIVTYMICLEIHTFCVHYYYHHHHHYCCWILSSGKLCRVGWFRADVSGLRIIPIFKRQNSGKLQRKPTSSHTTTTVVIVNTKRLSLKISQIHQSMQTRLSGISTFVQQTLRWHYYPCNLHHPPCYRRLLRTRADNLEVGRKCASTPTNAGNNL